MIFFEIANYPITSNQVTNGSIATNGYIYYSFEMGNLNKIVLSLLITSPGFNGTTALLLNNGQTVPDLTSYDFINETDLEQPNLNLIVELKNQASFANNWEIGVYCNQSCNYSLSLFTSFVCPNNCSGNGECSQDTQSCQCYGNYIPPDCSIRNFLFYFIFILFLFIFYLLIFIC